ncbi:MAG: 2-oxoacid:acceptor oxidoreductase family protein [Candidatus Pacearchaeota archaeon]|jgi:2-oxoglutarate ferredoxin oxidoreductase subunit alpha
MRLNILIGGKAGQGINKVSQIISGVLSKYGYYTFNYREYPSLIRGGHNFNILSIADYRIGSYESKMDAIIALDEKTIELHKKELKKEGVVIGCDDYCSIGRNANIAQAGALIKMFGVPKENLIEEIKEEFGPDAKEAIEAAENGFKSKEVRYHLKKLNNKVTIMTGSYAISQGAINSGINLYIGYPMTPATGVLHELAAREMDKGHMVFEAENEIAVINQALGASFAGAKTMIGTSGGGFDLMTEAMSMQGMAEIPLVVYLSTRPGPGTGIPTYSSQADLDLALRAGHGEFPRIVIAPGDPVECIEKTNEAFYLSEKYGMLSILLGDKHVAESEFGTDRTPNKIIPVNVTRKVPGEGIVKTSSYEHTSNWETTESPEIAKKAADIRIKRYQQMKKEASKFEMIKIHGNKNAKNLIIGWGSNKTAILDALDEIDESIRKPEKGKWKFLQVIYMKPLSDEIKSEIEKAKNVILVESNVTGQLGRLIREKTGLKISKRILKYDGKPFTSDELKMEILKLQ